jgi:hypothetical protein
LRRLGKRDIPLAVALVLALALAGLCGFAFHERYWKWRLCFNAEGRCYDTVEGVMLEQAGPIWGGLAVAFLVLAVGLAVALSRRKQP